MKKQNLPQRICEVCAKPFSWRKKWERDWQNVKYCSERCRRNKKVGKSPTLQSTLNELGERFENA